MTIKPHFIFAIFISIFAFSYTTLASNKYSGEILLWQENSLKANANLGEEKVRIYKETGDRVITNIHKPSITPFLPDANSATGTAIVIAPGGGHREVWIDHEGYNVAQWLSDRGIAAFVLKYRLANEENSPYDLKKHAVADMSQAVRVVRSRATEWNIHPKRIGVMGFSAGGELAALTDMLAMGNKTKANNPLGKVSSSPDFHALIYPGRANSIIPSKNSSPVFMVCGYQDRDDIVEGLPELFLKYKEKQIPAELHIYANAGHGFGLRDGDTGGSSKWPHRLYEWLLDNNLLVTR